jgi:hypothetical protein
VVAAPVAIAVSQPPTSQAAQPATRASEPSSAPPAVPPPAEDDRAAQAPTGPTPEPPVLTPPAGSGPLAPAHDEPATPPEPTAVAATRAPTPTTLAAPIGETQAPALSELLAVWPTIVAQLSENPPTKPLITKCRPVAFEGSIVTLGFPEEQAFLKDAAERRKGIIEAGIGSALGREVGVRCIVANVEIPEADAGFVLAEARRIFADDLIDVGEVS